MAERLYRIGQRARQWSARHAPPSHGARARGLDPSGTVGAIVPGAPG